MFTPGYIYIHTSAEGLPWWSIIPLTPLGCAIAIWLLQGIAFFASVPGERRLRRRVAAVHAAAGDAGPYSPTVVQAAATRLFADMHTAWDAGDRARLQQLSDPDLMADWAKRLDSFRAKGKRQRVKVVKGPKLRKEYTTEPIVPPAAAIPAPTPQTVGKPQVSGGLPGP